ncbi:MAG: DUF502 domain-containing protein [Chitinophagales bacterium]|nr:DUF502 domain-containing protein [Chitinophagales bacterium]
MKRFLTYLLRGVILIAPVFITGYIIYFLFDTIDTSLNNAIERIFGFRFPGLGIIVGLVLLTVVGFLSTTFIFKPLFRLFEELLTRTPGVKFIYSSIKDLFSAFVTEKKFSQPVLINLEGSNRIQRMGFITENDLSILHIANKVAVYVPDSYNFSGMLYIVPVEDITPLNVSATEIMKFMVSGGITHLNENAVEPEQSGPLDQPTQNLDEEGA